MNDKKQHNFGCHLIEKYNLYTSVDLSKICHELADKGFVEPIVRLLGKKSKHSQAERVKLQKALIEKLVTNEKNYKLCDTLCGKFDIPLETYPVLKEQKIKGSVRYFLGNYLRKKAEDKDHMTLSHVESLFDGLPECLVHLCEQLFSAGKHMEAKGIFNRHRLRADKFPTREIGDELKSMKYDKTKDVTPAKDLFEPISTPSENYLRLPTSIKIEFIDKEDQISYLEDLKG